MKSKQYIIGLMLAAMSTAIMADARVEIATGVCHAPFDNANVDNEAFLAGCDGILVTENGISMAYARVVREDVNSSFAPAIPPAEENGVVVVETTGALSGAVCVMVDSNGTEYETRVWDAETVVQRQGLSAEYTITYTVICWPDRLARVQSIRRR